MAVKVHCKATVVYNLHCGFLLTKLQVYGMHNMYALE